VIYIHVPFCRSFCTYCGFYSEICPKEGTLIHDYADAFAKEVSDRKDEIMHHADNGRNTLYIGGGTPSVLPLSVLRCMVQELKASLPQSGYDIQQPVATLGHVRGRGPALLGGVRSLRRTDDECLSHSGIASQDFEEFTMEVNPDDVVKGGLEYAEGLRELGVNRVSMGVQSFDDNVLKWMNRRHDAAGAEEAFGILREAGFDNLSIDLIFGFGDNVAFEMSVEKAISMGPEHISAYQLSIEPDSVLEKMVEDGRFAEADEELCRSQYDFLCRKLAEGGYVHYEVSNFAKPGKEAVHNSGYWDHSPYVGLGPAAHSFSPEGHGISPEAEVTRSWNPADVASYIAGAAREHELLDKKDLAIEDIMLGLRTARGVERRHLFEIADADAVKRFLDSGALVEDKDMVRIPEDHMFVSDDIIVNLLSG